MAIACATYVPFSLTGATSLIAPPFSASAHAPHALRLTFGSVHLATLERSLATVARVVADRTFST